MQIRFSPQGLRRHEDNGIDRRAQDVGGLGARSLVGAAHLPARVALLDTEPLAPAKRRLAQIVTDRAIGTLHGDRLILRDQSAQRTVGGGLVLDPWPPARGLRKP